MGDALVRHHYLVELAGCMESYTTLRTLVVGSVEELV